MPKQERWLVDRDGLIVVQLNVDGRPRFVEHQGKTYEFSEVYEDVQLYSEIEEEGQA